MTLRLVGAGLGRTGTHSLKLALEQLLGGRCYHMIEVFGNPGHVSQWHDATKGDMPDWHALFSDYVATVDWPGGGFWKEIANAFPDAPVLLSVRDDAEAWWRSADRTVFEVSRMPSPPGGEAWHAMCMDLFRNRFTPDWDDKNAAMAAYERHNDTVRAAIPADRLFEWRPSEGWEPVCAALGVPVPGEPFPHVNTTENFRAMLGLPS